jgi:hypothetical protein
MGLFMLFGLLAPPGAQAQWLPARPNTSPGFPTTATAGVAVNVPVVIGCNCINAQDRLKDAQAPMTGTINFKDGKPPATFSHSWSFSSCPGVANTAAGEYPLQDVIAVTIPISHIYAQSGTYDGEVASSITGSMTICSIGVSWETCPPSLLQAGADLGVGPRPPLSFTVAVTMPSPPHIDNFSPPSAHPDLTLTILGENFGGPSHTCRVTSQSSTSGVTPRSACTN